MPDWMFATTIRICIIYIVQSGFETDREAVWVRLKTREKCRTLRKSASADIADVAQSVERVHGGSQSPAHQFREELVNPE